MSHSVLEQICLAYTPLWDRNRLCCGMQLHIGEASHGHIDAAHLLKMLQEVCGQAQSHLLLRISSPVLLQDVLMQPHAFAGWIEVPSPGCNVPIPEDQLAQAAARGMQLVIPLAHAGHLPLLNVHRLADASCSAEHPPSRGCLHPSPPTLSQAIRCLDQDAALALIGWPMQDTLRVHADQSRHPDQRCLLALSSACEAEASIETLDYLLGQDPVLTYRLLLFVNSAAYGARAPVRLVRHALMMLGYSALSRWLAEQRSGASHLPDLHPMRQQLVWRALLMQQLLDAGTEDELRQELHLCGLFSGIHALVHHSPRDALHRLPIPQRIQQAIVESSGEYWPYLDMVLALESGQLRKVRQTLALHDLPREHVNRVLLRMLSAIPVSGMPPVPDRT